MGKFNDENNQSHSKNKNYSYSSKTNRKSLKIEINFHLTSESNIFLNNNWFMSH